MSKIYYWPFDNESNSYCERMKKLLSNFGSISKLNKKKLILNTIFFKRQEFLVLNWFENDIVDNLGNLSVKGILKVFIYFIFFRAIFRNFIFVRHNHYPHNCLKENSFKAKRIIDFLERIPHKVIIHSPVEIEKLNGNRIYVPHPLYEEKKITSSVNIGKKIFVIFGRIVEYKKIDKVIQSFPDNLKLIIVGKCEDENYLAKLRKMIRNNNIEIIDKFVSDKEAEDIIVNSQGLLITHNDDDMIVSGSFFYALTVGSKVYCLSTPFFEWVEKELGSEFVEVYNSLDLMNYALVKEDDKKRVMKKDVNSLFGDQVIINILSYNIFFNK